MTLRKIVISTQGGSGQLAMVPRPGRPTAAGGPESVRIVVADNHAIDRGGIVGLLDSIDEFEVAGESATVEATIQLCRELEPDVLLLALSLPGRERDGAIPIIREQLPQLRILALSERAVEDSHMLNPPSRRWLSDVPLGTSLVGVDYLHLAARQGAMATVRRNADPEDLFRAVHAVARGQAWYDPTTASGMLLATGRDNARSGYGRSLFSDRETQVAALIVEGQSNKEISASLGIGEPTVKKHVGHILEKLGVVNRLQAGLYLSRNPVLFVR